MSTVEATVDVARAGLAVTPRFVVRVAGLPMSLLAGLRCERTASAVEALLDLEDSLRVEGQALSQALHDVIGGLEDRPLRRRLLTLRRCVYQARRPRRGVLDDDVWAALPGEVAAGIAAWDQRVALRETMAAEIEAVAAAETTTTRQALAEAAADEWFQRGLALASRDLYAQLTKWLDAGAPADPQLEASLASYLPRAAAKTSPYSTFTSIAEGRWTPTGPPVRCASGWTSRRRGAVELAVRIVAYLRGELARWPEIAPHLPLGINPSLVENGTSLRFLTRRGGGAVVEVAATPTLRRVLETIRATPEGTSGENMAWLERLVELGLLEARLDVGDQSLDHLGELVDALGGSRGERVDAIRELLVRLRAQLAKLAHEEDARGRPAALTALDGTLETLYAAMGWTQRGFQPPRRDACFEDTFVAGLDCRFAQPAWEGVLDDLRLLVGLTGIYDRYLPARLATAAFFTSRWGPGGVVGFLDFAFALGDQPRRPESGAPDELQRQVATFVRDQPVGSDGIRRIDRWALSELIAGLPGWARPYESVAFYGQPMVTDGTPSFVLNTSDAGFRRAHARLRRLAGRAGDGGCAALALPTEDGEGALYAEVGTIAGSSLNLRTSPAAHEIVYPGAVSRRPTDAQILLGDLDVVHDPLTGRLRLFSRSRGRQVIPLHLGMIVDHLLPWAYRLLVGNFGVSTFCSLPQRLGGLRFAHARSGGAVGSPAVPRRRRRATRDVAGEGWPRPATIEGRVGRGPPGRPGPVAPGARHPRPVLRPDGGCARHHARQRPQALLRRLHQPGVPAGAPPAHAGARPDARPPGGASHR